MGDPSKLLSIIKVQTQELSSESIQEVLIAAKRQGQTLQDKDFWNEATQTLWLHLQEGLIKFDDQLLCATCFYTVLSLSDKQEKYLHGILEILRKEIDLRDKSLKNNAKTLQAVSLMYGMFQSSFLTQNDRIRSQILTILLQTVFKLLILLVYDYSKYTFIVFKTINTFKKICGTELQEILLPKDNKLKLLNLVNHNWENPITGVRDLNKGIFQTLIFVLDNETYISILEEINGFYWNKAKYLMLAEIINQSDKIMAGKEHRDWIEGLVNSLHKPGLVSAGTDMYIAIFKKIKCEDEWNKIFMKPVLDILCGVSQKAIENFSNYWCITTFRHYPALVERLLKELENIGDSENKLYSSLCVIKQANKLGLIKKNWNTIKMNYIEKAVLNGLEHTNNEIRMMAFDIICISQCKGMPVRLEYELVLNFLTNNINSDCTVLRISMLKSFGSFLTQIHMSYLNYFKDDEMQNLKYFCYTFQDFFIDNMNIGGNYQRKITYIKLAHTFLNGLKEVPKKKQKQTRKSNKTIIEMLKDEGKWLMFEKDTICVLLKHLKDPADDIRDNAGHLLMDHYTTELRTTTLINLLIEDALKCMGSKFFYEISCGQSMFKLIINILLQGEQPEAKFQTVGEVFDFALRELNTEYLLKTGIVNSIQKGKQLHSFMSIIQAVLEISLQQKHAILITNESVNTLLDALEGISNQFAWEEGTSTSSDFSKMSDMVYNLIETAGYNSSVGNEQTKISGLHQIVLNCLWLNVKASCELSSLLIKCQKDDMQPSICQKALDIICHVLETCRHKGAIEAAGVALGQSIQHLTSLPETVNISKLPLEFLKSKLNELISEAATMASVTRRGAGLSIMVHRVVSSDAKRGKPLFHYFMNTILDTCSKAEDTPNITSGVVNIDNLKDLPKAIYIHFLTRIVTDSSLASEIMFYSVELAEIAFGNLISPYWQIRNAALQLYGALIQKLIGQKKASGDEGTVATVACDELRTHSPKLWKYILEQLKDQNIDDDRIQYHSNLVPILNMLANIARRYNFSRDISEQKAEHNEMLRNLMLLLDSPIYTVRRLTAKSIFNIFTFEEVYEHLKNKECVSENYVHGSLMLIANFSKLHDFKCSTKLNKLKTKYVVVLNAKKHSYLSKEIFEELFFDNKEETNIQKTLDEVSKNSLMPGVFLWANKRLQKCVHCTSWDKVPELLKIIIQQNESESYCKILLDKIQKDSKIPEKVILEIVTILLISNNKYRNNIIWKILYNMILKLNNNTVLNKLNNIPEINTYLEKTSITYKLRYIIPFAAKISAIRLEQGSLPVIANIIESLIDPEINDVEMRYIAAVANNEFSSEIKNLPEQVKVTALKSAVILLQDEDEDVRMVTAKFYPGAIGLKKTLQPYICLCKIFDHSFLDTVLHENSLQMLKNKLFEYLLKQNSKKCTDEYNPFANESSNIYLEVNVFSQLIKSL